MTVPSDTNSSTYGLLPSGSTASEVDDIVTIKRQHPLPENYTGSEGCVKVKFDQRGYIPWDNPDNVVSVEVEFLSRRVQQNSLILFLCIGGPANVINMAVFFRQGLRDRVNLCLFALSLADLLHLITAIARYGEQLHMQFFTEERFGPVTTFFINNNFVGFFGLQWVAQVLTAVIATERCLCVLSPIKFQTLFSTRIMAVIIVVVYAVVLGLFFFVVFRYRVACVYDAGSGVVFETFVMGEVYKAHRELITYLDAFVFGVGLPVAVIVVVTTTTVITIIKLRQVVTWRMKTSSAFSASEVSLTKMLVGNSILFIACVVPDGVFRFACVFLPEMNTGRRHQNLFLSCLWLLDITTYVNSSFSIFVYYMMGSRYRQTFWMLFGRGNRSDGYRK